MRLQQFARKQGVSAEKVRKSLSDQGIEIDSHPNAKLSPEAEAFLETLYGTEEIVEENSEETETDTAPKTVSETATEAPITAPVEVAEVPEATPVEEDNSQEVLAKLEAFEVPLGPPAHVTHQRAEDEEVQQETVAESPKREVKLYKAIEDEEDDPNIELIKAPKIKLDGLKVLGKIEIPEPKKKELKEEEAPEAKEEAQNAQERQDRGRNGRQRRGRNGRRKPQKERLSPIEYERRKAEREALKKKKEKERAQKEKKKQHYQQSVKAKKAAPKPKREKVEVVNTPTPVLQPKAVQKPKKGIRKLWAWLNGEYDKF